MSNLGIEIGGTKLQLGVGHAGTITELLRRPVVRENGASGILDSIAAAVGELQSRHNIQAIGIGFGGPVNSRTGVVLKSHQVRGWDDVPLAQWCLDRWGLPCRVLNDCDTAALAEATGGAGVGCRSVFYVTVGTGIGGGFVIDGQVHGTDRPAASEIGHLRPGMSCIDTTQTVEAIAAGPGLATAGVARVQDHPGHPDAVAILDMAGSDTSRINGELLAAAAEQGNTLAVEVIDRAARTLGWAIAQTVTLLAPERVIIGGGVSLMPERLFLTPLRQAFATYAFPPLRDDCDIVPAGLGEEVVVHGALALAAQG